MLNDVDSQFHQLTSLVANYGHEKQSRTGHGTLMQFAQMMRFDLGGLRMPILSSRLVRYKNSMVEMDMFKSGNPSIKPLCDRKIGIWDSWFIPGTEVYDEPKYKELDINERAQMAVTAGWLDNIVEFFNDFDMRYPNLMGSSSVTVSVVEDNDTKWVNLPISAINDLGERLTAWDIPTKVLEPGRLCTFNERVEFAKKAGLGEDLENFADFEMVRNKEPAPAEFALTGVVFLEGNDPWDFSEEEIAQLQKWLTAKGIPTNKPGGGEEVSLKKRLSRVSKNDTAKWMVIYPRLAFGQVPTPVEGESHVPGVKVTGFDPVNEEFVDFELMGGAVPTVVKILDDLQVPKYRLLDASIGEGSYGVQWRKWQDTQMVTVHDAKLRDQYLEQGYTLQGYMNGHGENDDKLIMHREIDQLQNMIDMLKSNPDDRRMIMTAWNPGRTWQAALPPCHLYFQVVTWEMDVNELENMLENHGVFQDFLNTMRDEEGRVPPEYIKGDAAVKESMLAFINERGMPTRAIAGFVLNRSLDIPAGAVFNVCQYAYLLHSIAHVVNMEAVELVSLGVDAHVYNSQLAAMEEMLDLGTDVENDPRIKFKQKFTNIDDISYDGVEIVNYVPGPDIHIPIAV